MSIRGPAIRHDGKGVRTVYEAFGVRFVLDLFSRDLAARAEALLPSAVAVGPPTEAQGIPESPDEDVASYALTVHGDGVFRVSQGNSDALATRDLELALWTLAGLARDYIAFHASGAIFVRGAAVLYRRRAIILIGPSLSGRTTLAEALVARGATPWSDEYVVFDDDGLVGRFGSKSGDAASTDQDQVARLGMVVVTSFRPGIQWNPARGTEGDAVLAMLGQAIPARERSSQAMTVLRKAASGASTVTGDRGDVAESAPQILGCADEIFASRPISG